MIVVVRVCMNRSEKIQGISMLQWLRIFVEWLYDDCSLPQSILATLQACSKYQIQGAVASFDGLEGCRRRERSSPDDLVPDHTASAVGVVRSG